MKAPGLRIKFLIGSLGLALLFGLGTIVLVRAMLTETLEKQLRNKALFMARAMAEETVNPLLTDNMLALQMLCTDHKIPENDIEYIFIVNPDGFVIAHTFGDAFPVELKEANRVMQGQQYSIRPLATDKGSLVDIAVPILKGDLGTVRIGISDEPIKKVVAGIISRIAWIVIGVAALVNVIAIMLSIRITRPFAAFVSAVKKLGGGDLAYRIPVRKKDEIGQLAATFNMMVDDLQRTTVSRTHLESLVDERTGELSKTNERLVNEIDERVRTEKTLREINAKLETLIQAMPDAVFFKDCSGRYLMVNRAFEKITGLSSETVVGRTDDELLPPELAEKCRESDEALMKSGTSLSVEDCFIGGDGLIKYLDSVKAPIHDSRGNVMGMVGVSRDVTERRSADETIRRLSRRNELILKSAGEGICGIGLDGIIIFANPAVSRMTGWNLNEIIGKHLHDLLLHSRLDGSPYPRQECLIFASLKDENVHHHGTDEVFWRKDATNFPVEYTSSPITEEGRITGAVIVFNDISDQKLIEESLKTAVINAKEEKARTESIIAAIGDGINIQDRDYRIMYQNATSRGFYGYHVGEYCYKAFQNRDHVCERCHLTMSFKDGKVHTLEQRRTTDGGTFHYEITASPLRDASGNIVAGIELIREITERKAAEETLKTALQKAEEERAKSEAIIAALGDQMVIIDPGFRILYQNHLANQTVGDRTGEICYKAFEKRDAVCEGCPVELTFKDGMVHRAERVADSVVGTLFLDITASPLKDSSGRVTAVIEMVRDITERKKAEESLLLFKKLMNQSKDAITVNDPATGRFLIVNDEACRNLGYDRSELLTLTILDVEAIFPDQAAWDAHVDEVKGKGYAMLEGMNRHKNGTLFPVEVNVAYIAPGERDYMVAVVRDITERKKAAEALRKSEAMLQAIIDAEPECVKLLDREGRLVMMNRSGLAMIEAESLEQVKGQCVYPLVVPEYREPFVELTKNVFQGKSGSLLFEMVGAKGTRRWLDTHAVPFHNGKNEVVALLAVTRDVTERKAAESALKNSEERLSKAQQIAHIGNWEWNVVTNNLYWSEEVYRIYGLDPDSYVPTFESVGKAMHPDDLGPFMRAVDASLHEGKPFEMDYRLIRPDGTMRTVHTIGKVSCDDQGKPLIKSGTVQDITEQKETEEALRRSNENLEILVAERTAELTMMNEQLRSFSSYLQEAREKERTAIAREIHDELGQAMTALKMDFAWLKKKTPADRRDLVEKEASMSELIETTMQSIKRIATELRPGILDHLGLAAAIEWQAEEFEKRTGIKCKIVFQPEEIVVDRDRSTAIFRVFQETLTNIIRHARATKVKISLEANHDAFVLNVEDNGKGITEKQVANPKSLGLIGIRERVYFWSGSVTITGSRSSGTSVSVRIPLPPEEKYND